MPDLLDHLRATFRPESEASGDEQLEQVRSVALLVLDDLRTESLTPWTREKLYQLVNHRYTERLPTVFTSNVRPEHSTRGSSRGCTTRRRGSRWS